MCNERRGRIENSRGGGGPPGEEAGNGRGLGNHQAGQNADLAAAHPSLRDTGSRRAIGESRGCGPL